MSGGKFASLTAGLLVRKGEAMPSFLPPPAAPTFLRAPQRVEAPELRCVPRAGEIAPPAAHSPWPVPERPCAAPERVCAPSPRETAPPPEHPGKPRRLMVSLSPTEHETLGLIAVKKGATRHRLLREALDEYMALLVEEYGGDCQCIYTGSSCGNACSS